MAAGQPAHQRWETGYPTDGDMLLASLGLLTGDGWGPWQVVERDTGRAIGGAGFKGPPQGGSVEIGYGICAIRRRQGFAVEAVGALLEFAGAAGVLLVRAETEPGNLASQGVLEAAGFEVVAADGALLAWERRL